MSTKQGRPAASAIAATQHMYNILRVPGQQKSEHPLAEPAARAAPWPASAPQEGGGPSGRGGADPFAAGAAATAASAATAAVWRRHSHCLSFSVYSCITQPCSQPLPQHSSGLGISGREENARRSATTTGTGSRARSQGSTIVRMLTAASEETASLTGSDFKLNFKFNCQCHWASVEL